MLRAVTKICIESQHNIARRDVFKILRICAHSSVSGGEQTVVSYDAVKPSGGQKDNPTAGGDSPTPPPPPPPPPPRPSHHAWSAAAAVFTASLGGVYLYRKYSGGARVADKDETAEGAGAQAEEESPIPATSAELPARVQFLVVGGGTAAFAAMRALRAARPEACVLLVGAERALPYMRPPLSKELWREPDPSRAARPDALTFRQWNGKRRSLAYEPEAFYLRGEDLARGAAGAGLARGWRVARLDPARREAELRAGGRAHTVAYEQLLLATGSRPRRLPALAAAPGRSLVLRSAADAAELAARLERPDVRTVAVLGGGLLATELTAALADRLRDARVVLVCRERAPLGALLPEYLADAAAARLRAAGAHLLPGELVTDARPLGDSALELHLSSGAVLKADVVVECVGGEPATELAATAGLELDAVRGGVLVNAELAACAGVWAAGDVASYWDPVLGRRRVEHHDHAVLSGRRAGENMAAALDARPPTAYDHQSMFWSDLGPRLGYEAIGIIDSRLPTLGVFSADAVSGEYAAVGEGAEAGAARAESGWAGPEAPRDFARGVVLYVREERVVGVLLWNLFNRMHIARQVLKQGKFEDLFEVAKLFSPHEDD